MTTAAAKGASSGRPHHHKLAPNIIVEPSIQKGVGAGGAHPDEVAHGVGDHHPLLVLVRLAERVVEIQHEIEDVEREPGDGENQGDPHQELTPPPQTLTTQFENASVYIFFLS